MYQNARASIIAARGGRYRVTVHACCACARAFDGRGRRTPLRDGRRNRRRRHPHRARWRASAAQGEACGDRRTRAPAALRRASEAASGQTRPRKKRSGRMAQARPLRPHRGRCPRIALRPAELPPYHIRVLLRAGARWQGLFPQPLERAASHPGRRDRLALDGRAVHDPPVRKIDLGAVVHAAPVVPQHDVAYAPLVRPGIPRLRRVRP